MVECIAANWKGYFVRHQIRQDDIQDLLLSGVFEALADGSLDRGIELGGGEGFRRLNRYWAEQLRGDATAHDVIAGHWQRLRLSVVVDDQDPIC